MSSTKSYYDVNIVIMMMTINLRKKIQCDFINLSLFLLFNYFFKNYFSLIIN